MASCNLLLILFHPGFWNECTEQKNASQKAEQEKEWKQISLSGSGKRIRDLHSIMSVSYTHH